MSIHNQAEADFQQERHWYAIYTRPNFEKVVDGELQLKGLESFLPLHTVIRFWSDRKKKIQAPLFPSYVFVYANSMERYLSLQSRGVIRMVSFNSAPVRVPEEEIWNIRRILKNGYVPAPHIYLRSGDAVEVTSGPLMGLTGYFIEERGRNRLVVSVNAIQQSVSIEVERGQIRKMPKQPKRHTRPDRQRYRVDLI